jgi:hypothetical protein
VKKINLSFITIVFAINFSYAQNTNPWPSTGNVGIGTTNPVSALDVNGTGRFSVTSANPFNTVQVPLMLTNGAGNGGAGTQINFSVASATSYINSIIDGLTSAAGSALSFGTPSTGTMGIERMRIASSGNVGIGTTNPVSALDVNGTGRFSVTSANPFNTVQVPLMLTNGAGNGGAGTQINFSVASATSYINSIIDGLTSAAGSALSFGTPSTGTMGTERMRITSSGNIGIGTTSPDQKLTVKGTIHSQEIIVDMNILPDYVFKPTYHLPTLAEVKTYIDKNHHLPEMPSAEQVEKDGLSLGDINAKLLKKVEELTLYLIEQKEENDERHKAQQAQINKLKRRMAKLTINGYVSSKTKLSL